MASKLLAFAVAAMGTALVAGCSNGDDSTTTSTATICGVNVKHAVVSDLGGTLTTGAEELSEPGSDPSSDPEVREGAAELLGEYVARGYYIVYISERSESLDLAGTDQTATESTRGWLESHGFPIGEGVGELHLRPAGEDDVLEYKVSVLDRLTRAGWALDFGYGDTELDIHAFKIGGVDPAGIYGIGQAASAAGAIPLDALGYRQHMEESVAPLPAVCTRS